MLKTEYYIKASLVLKTSVLTAWTVWPKEMDAKFSSKFDVVELKCVRYFKICFASTFCLSIVWNFTILIFRQFFLGFCLEGNDELMYFWRLIVMSWSDKQYLHICRATNSILLHSLYREHFTLKNILYNIIVSFVLKVVWDSCHWSIATKRSILNR